MSCAQRANRSEPEVLPVLFESKSYSPYREYDIYAGQLVRTLSLVIDTQTGRSSRPRGTFSLRPLCRRPAKRSRLTGQQKCHGDAIDDVGVAELQLTATPRKPTFLQQERWKAVQRAKLAGLSVRRMARELGIHRDTVRRYIDAGSPPMRRSRVTPATLPSDTITE